MTASSPVKTNYLQMKIHAIAIDDEPVALSILKNHAENIDFLKLEYCFTSVAQAKSYLETHSVDLVFLDINMPDQSGLVMASELKPGIQFIFTTAYADFAVQGFELNATDYLLKPINSNRFLLACERTLSQRTQIKEKFINYIFLKSGYELVRVNLKEIFFIKAADNYSVLYLETEQIITRMPISELLAKLPRPDFVRVHKSYIISTSRINSVDGNQLYIKQYKIPISKQYKRVLIKLIT